MLRGIRISIHSKIGRGTAADIGGSSLIRTGTHMGAYCRRSIRPARFCKGDACDMKRLLFIYNPRAGKGLLKPQLSDIIDIFVKAGYEVVVYPTQAYRDAYKKVQQYDAQQYDLVVCSGGDGTIDEIVTGMMHRNVRTPVGYIPTGTTNDFANSLHIPKGLLKAADNAVNGVVFPCDVGRFNEDI